MADRKYYVLCDSNCKFESMTKEQILTAITQAVNEGTIGDIDTGFVTSIKTINGTPLKFFVGSQSEYEALSASQRENLFAIITNDTSKEAIEAALANFRAELDGLGDSLRNGSFVVQEATHAKTADTALAARANFADEASHADSADTATNADRATSAIRADSIEYAAVSSLEQIDALVGNRRSCAVTFSAAITIGGINFPAYSRGWLMSANDASLCVIAMDGVIYSAYCNNGIWKNSRVSKNATTAEYLQNGDAKFVRSLIWSGNKTIAAGANADFVTSEAANCKYLVIETDGERTFPICLDTTKHASISRTIGLANKFSIYMDNTTNNRVRITNESNVTITIKKIFIEQT